MCGADAGCLAINYQSLSVGVELRGVTARAGQALTMRGGSSVWARRCQCRERASERARERESERAGERARARERDEASEKEKYRESAREVLKCGRFVEAQLAFPSLNPAHQMN